MTRPVRIAHLVSHPIQYFVPLYRELARRPEIDLTVYFYSDATTREFFDPGFGRSVEWDTPLLGGYRSVFCTSAQRRSPPPSFLAWPQWDIVAAATSPRHDVVWAHGYAHLTTAIALAVARLRRKCILIREEQTLLRVRSRAKRLLKPVFLRALFSQATGLYIGEHNRAYMHRYGIPDERLVAVPYCVDNGSLRAAAAELGPHRGEIRHSLGIDDGEPVILFCGKLIEEKDPLVLLDAFARVRSELRCWLLVVGDGPLRPALEEAVAAPGTPNVVVAGLLNQSELPKAYVAADLFVLPSRSETWGLVVNEAMNFSLPVVVTDKVGCAPDLVRDGRNGYVVPAGDPARLAEAMRVLVSDSTRRADFGRHSRELVASYSIEAAADGIVAACLAQQLMHREPAT